MSFWGDYLRSLKDPAVTSSSDEEKASCEAKAKKAEKKIHGMRSQSAKVSAMPSTPEPEMPDVEVTEDFLKRLEKNRRKVAAFENEMKEKGDENK